MGDMGDDFRAFREMKNEQRRNIEPKRIQFALEQLAGVPCEIENKGDMLLIHIGNRVIQFWPFTGWFCGMKPIGHIKGRGIKVLKERIIDLLTVGK